MTEYSGDIAIVGMAGLYPHAEDVDAFWANILAGHDAVTEAAPEWLGGADIFDPDSDRLMEIYTRRGGFLGPLSRFNSAEFGTMPRSVEGAQPDQFLALKLCADALVDAGCPAGETDHTRTGVILGHAIHAHRANTNGIQQVWFHAQLRDILQALFPGADRARLRRATDMLQAKMPDIAAESVPGLVPNILTGRIANRLDLMGPNYIIDAACASSFIAVELAASELRAGHADIMLAGGVNTTTSPLVFAVFCSVNALSPSGRIRPFDAGANGTVLGEGAGAIVLKRLEDAIAGDARIYAVIRAVGQSSDGKSSGLMAPRFEGEVLAMRRAYETSGIDPATIGLVEAHGTGIPLGDQTEISALRSIFGNRDGAVPRVPLGSIKSMIGHCIPAAGSAAIIKCVHALRHRIVPPTLCENVSDEIGLADTQFYIPTEAQPWVHSAATPRRAAINAFGFGGINAHVILEESPVGRTRDATAAFLPRAAHQPAPEQVFVISAEPTEMRANVTALRETTAGADIDSGAFAALARQSWIDAGDHPARLAVIAADPADLGKKLQTAERHLSANSGASLQTRNGIYYEPAPITGKTAFLFPGEMAQYPGMMADAAMAFPPARAWFDMIAALFEGKREVRLQDVAFPPATCVDETGRTLLEKLLHTVDYGSEMVFAADQAVFELLTSLGVKPDGMLGHSTGENAAIVASGWFGRDRDEIGKTITHMNMVFNAVNESGQVPQGQLLTIAGLDREAVLAALERSNDLHFTMDNCPNQAIVFGPEKAVAEMKAAVVEQGAICTILPISWGYHTAFVTPMAKGFGEEFRKLQMVPNPIELWSCASAQPFPRQHPAFLDLAVAQYVRRVEFRQAIENMHTAGYTRFVECGPNATLTAFVRDILSGQRIIAVSADHPRRGMVTQLKHLVAQLYSAGEELAHPDILFHQPDEDERRRGETRARQQKAPALPSHLPYPTLDANEAQALRDLLGAGARADAHLNPATATAAPAGAPQAGRNGTAAIGQHIALMHEFLTGQERIARTAMNPAAPQRQTIEVLDITPHFSLPMAYRAILLRGVPNQRAMTRHLADIEQDMAPRIEGDAPASERWVHWSLGRLAVKRAARDYFRALGLDFEDAQICVTKSPEGVPGIALPRQDIAMPGASISHAGGIAVGAVIAPPWRIGVDIEPSGRVREPDRFIEAIASERELSNLPDSRGVNTATLIWTIKEAAAKTLGVGLNGRPRDFEIVEFDETKNAARVAHKGNLVDTTSIRLGSGVVSVGYGKLA